MAGHLTQHSLLRGFLVLDLICVPKLEAGVRHEADANLDPHCTLDHCHYAADERKVEPLIWLARDPEAAFPSQHALEDVGVHQGRVPSLRMKRPGELLRGEVPDAVFLSLGIVLLLHLLCPRGQAVVLALIVELLFEQRPDVRLRVRGALEDGVRVDLRDECLDQVDVLLLGEIRLVEHNDVGELNLLHKQHAKRPVVARRGLHPERLEIIQRLEHGQERGAVDDRHQAVQVRHGIQRLQNILGFR
mmetsp:Transcript_16123/g.31511  ORF Transcript_16123/g.31511 Transcript_16123/m.31511 type:complete len:246 (+) Transcript_16123:254-991(+)